MRREPHIRLDAHTAPIFASLPIALPRPTTESAPITARSRTCAWSPTITPEPISAPANTIAPAPMLTPAATTSGGGAALERSKPPQAQVSSEDCSVLDRATVSDLDIRVDDDVGPEHDLCAERHSRPQREPGSKLRRDEHGASCLGGQRAGRASGSPAAGQLPRPAA